MNIIPNDFPLQLISVYWCCSLREAINSEEEKIFFVKSLHKMVTPPSPFYEVPIYFFSDHFLIEKKDDFEGCLKGVDGCFKGA